MPDTTAPNFVYHRRKLQKNFVYHRRKLQKNFVYHQRKLQKNSVGIFSALASVNTESSGHYFSAVNSEASPIVSKNGQIGSQVGNLIKATRAPIIPIGKCMVDPFVSRSESIDGCSAGELQGSDQAANHCIHENSEFQILNDSCSWSKLNMELDSASMTVEVDCTGECSSSGVLATEVPKEGLSEKDLCISILRSEGVLGEYWPIVINNSSNDFGISGSDKSCKACGHSEVPRKMLICDHCDEQYHVSCCNPRLKQIPVDEWLCHSCLKKKHKIIREKPARVSLNFSSEQGRCKGELNPIAFMLKDTEQYTTGVRIGNSFQADVPDWCGRINNDADSIGEAWEIETSECLSLNNLNSNKPSRISNIGNWLQCREVMEGVGQGFDGYVCGKWRRAPLFEVQTDDWECFCSVRWDPAHADCAVPQELDTDDVLKQLKYIEMLRPRLDAKREKLRGTKTNVCLHGPKELARNVQTL